MAKKTNCLVHGKPMYRLRAKIGTDAEGKPVYKSFYGDGALDAKKKRDEYIAKLKKGVEADRNDSLLKLATYYCYQIMLNEDLAPGTIELYERQFKTKLAASTLALRPIGDIHRADLQVYLNDLAADPSVAPSAIRNLSKFMRKLFTWLSKQGYCDNLMADVSIPKKSTQRRKNDDISVFNEQEVKSIVNTPNRLHFLFLLALSTGLRLGEILALQYSDFKDGSVSVTKQLNTHYTIQSDSTSFREMVIQDTKTQTSIRTVPLPQSVQDALIDHRKQHMEEMMAIGYRTDFVFTTKSGKPIDHTNFRRAWQRHLRNADVPYRKFHACRATYCTMLCKQGISLETASKLMGHSDVSVTAQFYRAVSASEMRSAANKLDSLFSEPSGDKVATNEK